MLGARSGYNCSKGLGLSQTETLVVEVVETFVKGHDVFAVLLTGYGKSLCYGCSHCVQ